MYASVMPSIRLLFKDCYSEGTFLVCRVLMYQLLSSGQLPYPRILSEEDQARITAETQAMMAQGKPEAEIFAAFKERLDSTQHANLERDILAGSDELLGQKIQALPCPQLVKDLVKGLLTHDPEKRLSIPQVVAHPLLEALSRQHVPGDKSISIATGYEAYQKHVSVLEEENLNLKKGFQARHYTHIKKK